MKDTQIAALMEKIERLRRERRGFSSKKTPSKSSGARRHSMLGVKLPPKYRNPQNRSEVWAGRGLKPKWLQEALQRGKKFGITIDHFLVERERKKHVA